MEIIIKRKRCTRYLDVAHQQNPKISFTPQRAIKPEIFRFEYKKIDVHNTRRENFGK